MVKLIETDIDRSRRCEVVVHDHSVSESSRRHHSATFRRTAKSIEKLIRESGVKGKFILRPNSHITMRSNERWRVRRRPSGNITVCSRPGDNQTAWEYELYIPEGVDGDTIFSEVERLCSSCDAKSRDVPLIPAEIVSVLEGSNVSTENTKSEAGAGVGSSVGNALDDITKLLMSVTAAKSRHMLRTAEIEENRKKVSILKTDIQSLSDKLKAAQDRIAEIELEAEQDVDGRKALQLAETLAQLTKTNGIH